MRDDDFLPPNYLSYYRSREIDPVSADGRLLTASPLPLLAAHHYTTGGCYVLAGAMNHLTGLPIGVTANADDIPRHAFVVQGSDYIDASGRQQLAELMARDRMIQGLTIRQIVDMLLPHPNSSKIRADLSSGESKRYAVAAAEVVLAVCRPDTSVAHGRWSPHRLLLTRAAVRALPDEMRRTEWARLLVLYRLVHGLFLADLAVHVLVLGSHAAASLGSTYEGSRLVVVEFLAMFPQPPSLLLPTRARYFEQTPEGLLVARLTQVTELVHDDVLEDFRRRHRKAPREGEVALPRARAPACAWVADPDRLVLEPEAPRFAGGDLANPSAGLAPVPALDRAGRVVVRARDEQPAITQRGDRSPTVAALGS